MTPEAPNLYKLLGVSPSATGDEITRAYRNAMKRVHPDAQQPDRRVAAEERAKQLNHAYTTLSRPDRRRQYDTELRASMVQEQIMGRYVEGSAVRTQTQPIRSPSANLAPPNSSFASKNTLTGSPPFRSSSFSAAWRSF